MTVARVSRRPSGLAGLLSPVLDRLVFGRPAAVLGPLDEPVEGLPRGLLEAPTADVQGDEVVVGTLRAAGVWPVADVAQRAPVAMVPLLYDKYAMARFAETVPVATPRSWDEPPADRFPLVVKGRLGSGGQSVRVVRDQDELAAAVADLDRQGSSSLFFQEFSVGRLTVFGGVARAGRLLAGAAYRAEAATDDPLGPSAALEVVDSPGIDAGLAPLLTALGYTGFFCVDYIERADGSAALIDFNPRVFAGWLALQGAGVDLLTAYLSLFGLAAEPEPRAAPAGRRAVRADPPAADRRELGRAGGRRPTGQACPADGSSRGGTGLRARRAGPHGLPVRACGRGTGAPVIRR